MESLAPDCFLSGQVFPLLPLPVFVFFSLELGHLYAVAGCLKYPDRSICSFSFCQQSAEAGIKYVQVLCTKSETAGGRQALR